MIRSHLRTYRHLEGARVGVHAGPRVGLDAVPGVGDDLVAVAWGGELADVHSSGARVGRTAERGNHEDTVERFRGGRGRWCLLC